MQNGHDQQHQISINPQQAATFALQFLEQVPHTRAQREAYDIATGMLQAIVNGQVILAPPPPPLMGQTVTPEAPETPQ
jgi:hypothetical protein